MRNKNQAIELNNRNNSLNLLRLVFATLVLIGHASMITGMPADYPDVFSRIITLAVPMFFVVSGYLITASAIRNDLKKYFKKRFARIYPAYFIMLLFVVFICAPLVYSLNHDLSTYFALNPSPLKFILYGLGLFLFSPNIGDTLSVLPFTTWNASAWTLIFEFGCYVAIFILMKTMKNKRKCVILLYVFLILLSIIFPIPEGQAQRNVWYLFVYSIYLFSVFLSGSILYLFKDWLVFKIQYFIITVVICGLAMYLLPYHYAVEVLAIPLAYNILYISLKVKSPEFLQKNDISYGIYVYGWPVQSVIAYFMLYWSWSINLMEYTILSWTVTAIIAAISWFLVEKPVLDRVR